MVHKCCGEEGYNPFPRGTVGTIALEGVHVAIVLSDGGTFCGAGDDIKIVYKRDPEPTDINDWEIGWFGALDFTPDDQSLKRP